MSQPFASCYLTEPEDQANYLYLTTSYLKVLRKGRERKYRLSPMLKLEINHRTLLGPLIGGALLSCISLITLFTFDKWPLPLLILSISGVLLVYLGATGVYVLTLQEDKIHYDIVLPKVSEALPAFVRFTNQLIPGFTGLYPLSFTAWFIAAQKPTDEYYGDLYLNDPGPEMNKTEIMKVELMKLPFEVSFEFDKQNNYKAKIKHAIPADAFVE